MYVAFVVLAKATVAGIMVVKRCKSALQMKENRQTGKKKGRQNA